MPLLSAIGVFLTSFVLSSAVLFGGSTAPSFGGGTGTLNQIDQWKATTTPYVAITTNQAAKNVYIPFSTATSSSIYATTYCINNASPDCITAWPTGSGGGGSFPFTPTTYGVSTSTTVGFLNGLFSTASSTFGSSFHLPALSQGFAYIGSLGTVNSIASSSVKLSWFTNDAGFLTSYDSWSHPSYGGSATTSLLTFGDGFIAGNASSTIVGTLHYGASDGILKTGGTNHAVSVAANGTDYTLITANTCSAGQHVSAVAANGTVTCSADSGGSSPLATSSSETYGQLPWWDSTSGTPAKLNGGSPSLIFGTSSSPSLSPMLTIGTGAGSDGSDDGFIDFKTYTGISTKNTYVNASGGNVTITLPATSGILPVGTGASSRVAYWSGTNQLTSNSGFTFDGTKLTVTNASTTVLSGSTLCISTDCRTAWPSAAASTTLLADANTFSGANTFSSTLKFSNYTSGGLAVDVSGNVYKFSTSTWRFASSTLLTDNNKFSGSNTFSNGITVTNGLTVNGSGAISLDSGATNSITFSALGSTFLKNSALIDNALTYEDYITLYPGNDSGTGSPDPSTISVDGTQTNANLQIIAKGTGHIILGNASSTLFTATTLCLTGDTCRTTWPSASASSTLLSDNNTFSGTNTFSTLPVLGTLSGLIKGTSGALSAASNGTDYTLLTTTTCTAGDFVSALTASGAVTCSTPSSGAAYPFALTGNATSTLTQFNGGLTAFASSTIGDGTQTGGLTISGGATTTGNAYFAGNVGIGTSSPFSLLTIQGSNPATSIVTLGSTIFPQEFHSMTASPSSGSNQYYNVAFEAKSNASVTTGGVTGIIAGVTDADTTVSQPTLTGGSIFARHQGTANQTNLTGVILASVNQSASTVTNGTGFNGLYQNVTAVGATTTNAYAIHGQIFNTSAYGLITNANALRATIYNGNANATISDARGLNVANITNTGTITNTYGVYVDDITTGTQTNTPFSFYASDANALNYFAGNTGIGTTSPYATLSVNAPAATTAFAIGSTTATILYIDANGKAVFRDSGTGYSGVVSPLHNLAVQMATTTAWTGTSTAPYSATVVMPFAGTLRDARCKTDTGTLEVQTKINSTILTYMAITSTQALATFSSSNTFAAGDVLTVNAGNPATSPTTLLCTFRATETP